MQRITMLILSLALGAAALAANISVVVNGKTVQVPMTVVKGTTYVDVAALAKVLGNATYDAKTKKLVIKAPAATGGAAGTAQLAGDNGELGKLYTLRKGDPFYFTLLSAEFTVNPVVIGDRLFSAKADEKLLVLRFTIQNPNKTDRLVRWDSLRFMAVDAMNVNHEGRAEWGDALTRQGVQLQLKPAQKLEMYTVIPVPAKGEIPKLMVQSNRDNDGPVLRYDLRGKAAGLPAPIADPSDTTGATALNPIPSEFNKEFSLDSFAVTLESTEFVSTALDAAAPANGGRFLVLTARVKNLQPIQNNLRWDAFQLELLSTDGEKLRYRSMLLATANRPYAQQLKAGDEARVRLYFDVPKDATPQTLTISQRNSHAYTFTIPQ